MLLISTLLTALRSVSRPLPPKGSGSSRCVTRSGSSCALPRNVRAYLQQPATVDISYRLKRDWRSALAIVKPETVIGWHRQGFRRLWR